ncbi:MAG TPA: response regulator transcription factor [Micromonosporaceae bacterium]|jgi:DNA-binding response OmpR family regulator
MRILVVEDEPRLGRALQRGLTAEGYRVDLATDGIDGLEAARHEAYDTVILDIMLPRLSGYRVVRTLREEGIWVPVLILSAKDGEYDEADGLDCGADDYLTKPFSFVVLLARLRALHRRGAPERPTVLAVGTLRLDPASRRVVRDDTEITLTAREYALLEYLMRRQDQVVTKIELLDRVWDAGADTDPNVVEVYVGYLRRKIDQPFERHSLQTVRGAGYRLFDETKADAVRGATGADPIDEIDAHACAGDGATADSMDTAETGAGSAPAPREG